MGNPSLFFQKRTCVAMSCLIDKDVPTKEKVSRPAQKSLPLQTIAGKTGGQTWPPVVRKLSSSLGALLPVALHYFAFRVPPILSFAAVSGAALLVEFECSLPDLVFQIDGDEVLS